MSPELSTFQVSEEESAQTPGKQQAEECVLEECALEAKPKTSKQSK